MHNGYFRTDLFTNHEIHEKHENFWLAVLLNRCFSGFPRTKSWLFVRGKQ